MSVPLDSVHTMSVSVHSEPMPEHYRFFYDYPVVSGIHRLLISWFLRAYALADLPTLRRPSTRPVHLISNDHSKHAP